MDNKLKNLKGMHILTGIGERQIEVEGYGFTEKANSFSFELDGKIYTAIEDPVDGYRSMMDELKEGEGSIDIKIPPTKVVCKMKANDSWQDNEVLEFVDVENGEVVLEIGTANTNDYYPMFVANWIPEKLHYN